MVVCAGIYFLVFSITQLFARKFRILQAYNLGEH